MSTSNSSNTVTSRKHPKLPALPRERTSTNAETGEGASLSPRHKKPEALAQGGATQPSHSNEPVLSGGDKSASHNESKDKNARTRRHSAVVKMPSQGEADQQLSPPTSPRRSPSPRASETPGRAAPPPPPQNAKPNAGTQTAQAPTSTLLTGPTRNKGPKRRLGTTAMPAAPGQPSQPIPVKRDSSPEKDEWTARKPSPPEQRPAPAARPAGGIALPVLQGAKVKPLRSVLSPRPASQDSAPGTEPVSQGAGAPQTSASASIKLANAVQRLLAAHGARLEELGIRDVLKSMKEIFLDLGHTDLDVGQATMEALNKLTLAQRMALAESPFMADLEAFGNEGLMLPIFAEQCALFLADHFQQRAAAYAT